MIVATTLLLNHNRILQSQACIYKGSSGYTCIGIKAISLEIHYTIAVTWALVVCLKSIPTVLSIWEYISGKLQVPLLKLLKY